MFFNHFSNVDIKPLRRFIFEKDLLGAYQLKNGITDMKHYYMMPEDSHINRVRFSTYRILSDTEYSPCQPNSVNSIRQHCNQTSLLETLQVNWLIHTFNKLFKLKNTILVKGESEPEYFPATLQTPAKIVFAHGFLASALHEISHWTIAGTHRRTLSDFGYWYAPDGRTKEQQQAFERFEIKPQAIECLFTLMLNKPFNASKDNLHADFDTSDITFENNVLQQVYAYIQAPRTLPPDAIMLLTVLAHLCNDNKPTSY